MNATLIAVVAGVGTYLIFSALVLGQKRLLGDGSDHLLSQQRARIDDLLAQAGLSGLGTPKLVAMFLGPFAIGAMGGWIFFGGVAAPVLVGVFVATFPFASFKAKRKRRRSEAADAWPRMIEEIRLLCGSLGRPIPQALVEVGKQGPVELRPAFLKAEREWLMSTDFNKTVAVLKDELADPTADATCETLLVAHALGGNDIDKRLLALAEDRRLDLQGRKDACAKQAGVRFARRFVLIVPIGMAVAGLSIGDGRASYATTNGQIGVSVGVFTLAACWIWAGRLITLPDEERVFRG